jgi:hypothetical protein
MYLLPLTSILTRYIRSEKYYEDEYPSSFSIDVLKQEIESIKELEYTLTGIVDEMPQDMNKAYHLGLLTGIISKIRSEMESQLVELEM